MIKQGVSADSIVSRFSQKELWTMALGFYPGANRFSNPFRDDKTPDCYLKESSNKIRMYDWGSDLWNGIDALEALKLKWGYKYISDVISHLNNQRPNIINSPSPNSRTVLEKERKIDIRTIPLENFTDEMMAYWSQYHIIDEDFLRRNHVYPVRESWFNTRKDPRLRKLNLDTFTFSLYFQDTQRQKLYSPLSPFLKWYSNTTHQDVFGLHDLHKGRELVITSSCKDMIVLKQICRELQLPIDVIAPNGEGMLIRDNALDKLSKYHDISKAYLWYDLDRAGFRYALSHKKKYNCKHIHNPFALYPIKDPSDLVKNNHSKIVEDKLCSLIK